MTWFAASFTERSFKLNPTILGRENNLWQKLANFFLARYSSALATGFRGSPIVWRKWKRESMTSRDQGCRGMVDTHRRYPRLVFVHLWYEGLRIWGRVVSSTQGLQAELPPLYETRRGSKIWCERARANTRPERTHALTHACTHARSHPSRETEEGPGSRKTRRTGMELRVRIRNYGTHRRPEESGGSENCSRMGRKVTGKGAVHVPTV